MRRELETVREEHRVSLPEPSVIEDALADLYGDVALSRRDSALKPVQVR